MTTLHAKQALLPDGWAKDVRLMLKGRRISAIERGVEAQAGDERHEVLLPTMANLHSHAFQRGMAGLAELRGPDNDSFWSWRTVMYRFALTMNPEQMQAIAAQLYVEMLEVGFGRVGEFHYLHHDRDGSPYNNRAEMAERIVGAAEETGIGLTLLPVFYAHSGFGGLAPNEGQRRFINDLDGFAKLLEGAKKAASNLPGNVTGIAPHSLRAVTPEELSALQQLSFDGPIHIHVAEQVKEVDDCVAWSGKRPVAWLLDNADLSSRWCLIHATHMTDDETMRMAKSGAIAGLCPITEANLGDGTFNAEVFLGQGGRFGIGSDSNILIGIADELRQLEYSQRLAHRARNVMAVPGGSTGRYLFDGAVAGGAAALMAESGLSAGKPADLVSLKSRHDLGLSGDQILDSFIFANGAAVDCVWVGGAKQVEAGRHIARERVAARFAGVMQDLMAAF
ncbi:MULTISPECIES: formimidoylglutamate deiminase [Rhizobium/Agrobacterium group]|uniref:Hydrolase n=2 Tax=Rhizobium/Agrobacterium group TaxID=227290 RepID=B9K290_ALLAM|nr:MULTISPECIES: formimidoylglutamate deiminase [Rhizobium/Agrobacterium group]ACM38988.1 hydrolase [Allorhizobium ampelinum S4]MCF1449678.1 formimidoylglutamate deiminase [Allorhizobium ampelinum]MCF1495185.1 formimidoylglutamate deiminase [Allorhizobium ampelinum]MUO31109.1 formimidoylglutamate deiminase [Agrobacterium vitis]MUO44539.1 formimidoylglutamate deiminase [Agrobacterium vitis]